MVLAAAAARAVAVVVVVVAVAVAVAVVVMAVVVVLEVVVVLVVVVLGTGTSTSRCGGMVVVAVLSEQRVPQHAGCRWPAVLLLGRPGDVRPAKILCRLIGELCLGGV